MIACCYIYTWTSCPLSLSLSLTHTHTYTHTPPLSPYPFSLSPSSLLSLSPPQYLILNAPSYSCVFPSKHNVILNTLLILRTAVDSILLKLLKPCQLTNRIASYEGTRLRVISVVWFFLSLTLALFIPQISYIIEFTGGLAATFIFIFPGTIVLSCN